MSNLSLRDRFSGHAPMALARIVSEDCIGCALCIKACPFDAIIGTYGWLHEVLDEACVGCELCVPKCPVDCIVMESQNTVLAAEKLAAAKNRLLARKRRLANQAAREKSAFEEAREAIKKRLARQSSGR